MKHCTTLARCVAAALVAARVATRCDAQVTVRPPPARRRRAAELADLQRRPTTASATARSTQITPANVDEPRAEVGAAEPGVRRLAVEPARRRRHHVRHAAAERRDGASTRRPAACSGSTATRRRPTRASAAAPTTAASRSSATRSSWARSTRTSSRSTRRTASRSGTSRSATSKLGLLDHDGAARRQGQGDRRRRRRRVRHPRLHRRLRREDRQGSVALLHDSRARRARARDVERRRLEDTAARSVWVTGSYDPDAEPHLLGHRQSRARLESRSAARRQPLLRLASSRSTPTPAS